MILLSQSSALHRPRCCSDKNDANIKITKAPNVEGNMMKDSLAPSVPLTTVSLAVSLSSARTHEDRLRACRLLRHGLRRARQPPPSRPLAGVFSTPRRSSRAVVKSVDVARANVFPKSACETTAKRMATACDAQKESWWRGVENGFVFVDFHCLRKLGSLFLQ